MGVIDVHDEAFVKRSVGTRGVDRAISWDGRIEVRTNLASDRQCP